VPGQSLEAAIHGAADTVTVIWIVLPLLLWAVAALEWWAKVNDIGRQPWAFAAAALVVTLIGARRIYRARGRIKALKLGLAGERAVGQFLEGLRVGGARILHDIQGDDFNVDHVVISSRGIYCIETKTIRKRRPDAVVNYDGKRVLVDGMAPDRDPIKQVTAAAKWLSTQIADSTGKRFWVRPVVVYPGWFVESSLEGRSASVWVLELKALAKWIENEPTSIDDTDVSLVAYHLSRIVMAEEMKSLDL
jgi:hypothetical protein